MIWWQAIIASVTGGGVVAFINQWLGRRKSAAETSLLAAQYEKTLAEAEKIRAEITAMKDEHTKNLKMLEASVSSVAEVAEDTALAVHLQALGTLQADSGDIAGRLRRIAGRPRRMHHEDDQEIAQLESLGLIRLDTYGSVELTSLGRRMIARG